MTAQQTTALSPALTPPAVLADWRRDVLTIKEVREIDILEVVFLPGAVLFFWAAIMRVIYQMAMLLEPVGWFVMGMS